MPRDNAPKILAVARPGSRHSRRAAPSAGLATRQGRSSLCEVPLLFQQPEKLQPCSADKTPHRNSRHCPRRTPIRERRTRLRARTPAGAQARHEVAVNFTTDRTFPRNSSARGYDVHIWPGNGRRRQGLAPLRSRTSQSIGLFTRSIRNLSPLAVIPSKKRQELPMRQARSPRNCQAGGISDSGISLSRRRSRSLHHPACFYMVSFALRASKSQLTRSEDALKQPGPNVGRRCPLSDLCISIDKFRRPFFRRCV